MSILPEPTLFDPPTDNPPARTPLCSSCRIQPAKWSNRHRKYEQRCGGRQCHSPDVKCHACDTVYRRGSIGAGTKYCSTTCKDKAYGRPPQELRKSAYACSNCGNDYQQKPSDYARWNRYNLCHDCREYAGPQNLGRLARAGVPHQDVLHFIREHTCMNPGCGRDIRHVIRLDGVRGWHSSWVIDHDHNICHETTICAKCYRGIICTPCNLALGYVNDDPNVLTGLATYLERPRP